MVKNVSGKISTISFKSCEEGREKFQGSSLDYVWFDEEPPEEIYIECAMRVLDKKGDLFGTMTPLKGLTFVYDKIYLNPTSDPEIFTIFMDWNDNPYLPEEEIERLKSVLSAEELEARQYGKFVDKSNGLVYTEFNESVNVIEPFAVPKEWYSNISIDPGLKNPTSCHWYAVDGDGNIFVIYEHYESNQNIDYHSAKIKSICEILDWPVDSRGYYNAIIDTASTQHTLNNPKSVADLFYENKILVNPKVNKDLFAGISRVKSYFKNALGQSKLFIFSNCVNLIKEIKSYRWGKLDVPIKKDDHALDELRYFVMTRPEAYTAVEVKNEIQKDKENLFKKILSSRRRSGF